MIKNYLTIAIRNLVNKKVFSLINILGLSFGLACTILIGLWVYDEVSKDQFHENEVYHLLVNITPEDKPMIWTNTPAMTARLLKDNISGVEHAIKVSNTQNKLFFLDDRKFTVLGLFADSAFFEVFSYPLISGDRQTAIYDMNSVAVSRDLAIKLYGTTDVVGKTVEIEDQNRELYKITAVYDVPVSSSTNFDFVIPYHKYRVGRDWMKSAGNFNDDTYVTLKSGIDRVQVEEEFSKVINEMYRSEGQGVWFHLYPYKDMYLKSNFENWPVTTGRIQYVKLLTIVGIVILLIACINFMNLSTAQASKRAKEVGIRKSVGARKESLVMQFLGESMMITFIAMVLALTIADLLMPAYNTLVEKDLTIPFGNMGFVLAIIAVFLITGLISGSYPALYLSRFQAAHVLKGAVLNNSSMGGIRKYLVIFQFVLSITLIISTIVIYNQLNYIKTKDLGIGREHILTHWMANIGNQREAYKNELLNIPGVESVSIGNFNPMMIYNSTTSVNWSGKTDEDDFFFHVLQTDEDFLNTFNANLISGKNLPEEIAQEDTMIYFMLNETAVKMMNLEDPVGSQIAVWGYNGKVTGVVEDFNHHELYKPVEPVVILRSDQGGRNFIKLKGSNIEETIASINSTYDNFEKDQAFSYHFLDDEFNALYKNVTTVGKLSSIFSGIAIFISCLGLFGLSSYMSEQRKKETGIRKVMGASVFNLTYLFSLDYLKLVLISFVIASPIAWYLTDGWLDDFAYKISPSPLIFIMAGGTALLIALGTVSYHTIKTSIANPVNSLRNE